MTSRAEFEALVAAFEQLCDYLTPEAPSRVAARAAVFSAWDAALDRLAEAERELTRWQGSFAGHVYVTNERYSALVADSSALETMRARVEALEGAAANPHREVFRLYPRDLDMPPDGSPVGFRHDADRPHPCDFACGGTWVCTACGWESKDSGEAAGHPCRTAP